MSSLNSIIVMCKIVKIKHKYNWPMLYLKLCCRTGKGSRSSSLSANWLNRSRTTPTSSPSSLGCPSGLVFLVWCPSALIPSCETFVLCCTGTGSNPPVSRPGHYSRNIHVKKTVVVFLSDPPFKKWGMLDSQRYHWNLKNKNMYYLIHAWSGELQGYRCESKIPL